MFALRFVVCALGVALALAAPNVRRDDNGSKAKQAATSVPMKVMNCGSHDECYRVDVSIGTPPQKYRLTLDDTMFVDIHVFSSKMPPPNSTCKSVDVSRKHFDPSASSTYVANGEASAMFGPSPYYPYEDPECTKDPFGFGADGFNDTIQIGSVSVPSVPANMITVTGAPLNPEWDADGFFGIQPPFIAFFGPFDTLNVFLAAFERPSVTFYYAKFVSVTKPAIGTLFPHSSLIYYMEVPPRWLAGSQSSYWLSPASASSGRQVELANTHPLLEAAGGKAKKRCGQRFECEVACSGCGRTLKRQRKQTAFGVPVAYWNSYQLRVLKVSVTKPAIGTLFPHSSLIYYKEAVDYFDQNSDNGGMMTLGGVDTSNCDSTWTTIPSSKAFVGKVMIESFSIKGKSIRSWRYALSDVTTSYITAPDAAIDAVVKATGAEYDFKTDTYQVDCDKRASLPDMVFSLPGMEYHLPAVDYARRRSASSQRCTLMLASDASGFGSYWKLGTSFFRPYCTLFDFKAKTFSLAKALH